MIECPTCGCNNIDRAQQCEKCASPLLGSDLRCGLYTYGGTSNGQVLQRRYIITRELSSDFTGVKYLAEDAEEKKDVIIWALPVIASEDEEKIQSISELCNRLEVLTDGHILNVFGFYSKNNARYFVTEYVDGCSLEEKVASEGPLNLEQVLEIFSPIARSIDLAHRQGFIHGDICPANVLINSKGVIKLANFAIGKEIKEMLSRISPEGKTEPSLYTAPELLGNAACSAQSDIYSLAACIYQSLYEEPFRRQFQELEQEPGQLAQLSEKQNEVLLRSLSINPHDRHGSAVELLTELRESAAEKIVEKVLTEPEQISYEQSLADLKQKTQDWNRDLEETINKLMADVKWEKQKYAEILRQTQAQARQQAEQLRADYEGKIEQLKAKIEEAQAELAAALSEVDRKTEGLVAEKEKALQESREHEEAINKLIADAEWEKQKHAEMLSKAQAQIREQAEQELADYERKIDQLRTKIADAELAAVAALGQTDRNTEALTAEKEKALQQSREHEEAIRTLITDTEKEIQQHLEILSQTQTPVRQQAEQQLADYEGKIKQLEDRITEEEAKLATTMSEANRKAEQLAAEKENALQQSREYEDVIKKLIADSEKEKQQHLEILNRARTQTEEQAGQLRADYDKKIELIKESVADAQLTAATHEAEHKAQEVAAEKQKALQKSRKYEEDIKKLIADAEKEKQKHAELLSQAQTQANQQTQQLRADYEETIERLKATIKETETKLVSALSGAQCKAKELAEEKEKSLQQSKEHQEALEKVRDDISRQRQISAGHFGHFEPQTQDVVNTPPRSKTSRKVFALVLIAVSFIITGYIYVQQFENPFKQLIATKPPRKPVVSEPITDSTSSTNEEASQIRNEIQSDVTEQTSSEPAAETAEPQIKLSPQIENRPQMGPYFLCLSQATTAQKSGDLDKAVELYTRALTYYDNKETRKRLESAKEELQMSKTNTAAQGWLESASDFE